MCTGSNPWGLADGVYMTIAAATRAPDVSQRTLSDRHRGINFLDWCWTGAGRHRLLRPLSILRGFVRMSRRSLTGCRHGTDVVLSCVATTRFLLLVHAASIPSVPGTSTKKQLGSSLRC
ncbi:hypothetical protein PAXINDRAFT_167457 [Paxillus involutus ATCC 200175]|nr:hypothetical protein PAXINDRAFT_167457 [Paxillus involutus ATCC 200175]